MIVIELIYQVLPGKGSWLTEKCHSDTVSPTISPFYCQTLLGLLSLRIVDYAVISDLDTISSYINK